MDPAEKPTRMYNWDKENDVKIVPTKPPTLKISDHLKKKPDTHVHKKSLSENRDNDHYPSTTLAFNGSVLGMQMRFDKPKPASPRKMIVEETYPREKKISKKKLDEPIGQTFARIRKKMGMENEETPEYQTTYQSSSYERPNQRKIEKMRRQLGIIGGKRDKNRYRSR